MELFDILLMLRPLFVLGFSSVDRDVGSNAHSSRLCCTLTSRTTPRSSPHFHVVARRDHTQFAAVPQYSMVAPKRTLPNYAYAKPLSANLAVLRCASKEGFSPCHQRQSAIWNQRSNLPTPLRCSIHDDFFLSTKLRTALATSAYIYLSKLQWIINPFSGYNHRKP